MGNINNEKEDILIENKDKNVIMDKKLAIDGLDGKKKEKEPIIKKKDNAEVSKTPSDKEPDKEKKETPIKSLIEALSEEEIRDLLAAKQSLEEKNQLLDEKSVLLVEYEDLLKRKQAEFENYRKRVQKEIEKIRKYATAELVLDVITILDDFDRAISSAESSKDFESILEGIVIIKKQFRSVLEKKYGVKKIEAVGKEFDPTIHDAIMMEESDKYHEDIVVEDFQKGYIMHDRIIRPSKVKVVKAVSSGNVSGDNIGDKIKETEES